jgi:hypothetical protein
MYIHGCVCLHNDNNADILEKKFNMREIELIHAVIFGGLHLYGGNWICQV